MAELSADLVLKGLMERLNVLLTGNSMEKVRSESPFRKTVEDYIFDSEPAYYLSDAGCSRLCWVMTDDRTGKLVLANVSLEGPRSRWDDPEVADLRNQVEEVIGKWMKGWVCGLGL